MKTNSLKKFRIFLLTCLVVLATAFCTILGVNAIKPTMASAETLSSTEYKTDGASVRVFEKDESDNLVETTRKGIRFHVEMGEGYQYNGTTLLDTTDTTTNPNGAYKMKDGFKSYTLIIPTRLMGGSTDLSLELKKVMAIDTTGYWFSDSDGNWESVAYIHSIPDAYRTETFAFKGIICTVDENGNVTGTVANTDLATRRFVEVSKLAYADTIADGYYWGSQEKDNQAAEIIKGFIPTLTINYGEGSEEVLWGEKPTSVTSGEWYNETSFEKFDETASFSGAVNQEITVKELSVSETFVFTGVEYTANGFNVFATLPTANFADGTSLETSALDMVKGDGTAVSATAISVAVIGTGDNAVSKLCISFSYDNISNGDTLTILRSSNFYYNGALYVLEKDYQFVYNNSNWELPLGYILQGDIASIVDYEENRETNIRVTFVEDFLVNGTATLSGNVYINRVADSTRDTIASGYYYWNQGAVSILEMPYGAQIKGEDDGDTLVIEAGARLVQNNGYYEFSETIEAVFDGNKTWVTSVTEHEIAASEFISAATRYENGDYYIDVQTNTKWADKKVNIVFNDGVLTYHHTDNVTEFNPMNIVYYGNDNNQLLRIYIDGASVTGDWVTIPAGTEFWLGNVIYRLTEAVISYFVDTNGQGLSWVTNPVINPISNDNITQITWSGTNLRIQTDTVWSTVANNKVVVDDTFIDGDGLIVEGTMASGMFYYGGTNNLLELQGINFSENGGSVTLKTGAYLWLFENNGLAFTGAYQLTEDITFSVVGAAGSTIYRDTEIATITKDDISGLENYPSHEGEIRVHLPDGKVTGYYDRGRIQGSASINGEETTSAFIYSGDGTGGYKGNTILAFTGVDIGKAFNASAVGDRFIVTAGTKVWTRIGYITIVDELDYTWDGDNWVTGFNDETKVGELTADDVNLVLNDGTNEIRLRIPRGILDTYYGPTRLDGTAQLTKVNGEVVEAGLGYWYSGTTYNTDHTLIGLRGVGFAGTTSGDTLTIFAGTKLVFHTSRGIEGYCEFTEDISYTYVNNAWQSAEGWDVTFAISDQATVTINSEQITNGMNKRMPTGSYTMTVTPNSGYAITGVTNAVNNMDGTYTLSVNNNATISVTTKQSIQLAANSVADIQIYSENGLTGVRLDLNEATYTQLNLITSNDYDYSVNGKVSVTSNLVETSFWAEKPFNFFGGAGNLLELRFDTSNLVAGDQFKITKGTVFYHSNTGYALEFTEDIIGVWIGHKWVANPTKIGDLNWNSALNTINSYSDFKDGVAINYTIRLFMKTTLFGGATYYHQGFAQGTATINGSAYTGTLTYHGNSNNILQIDVWNYAQGDVLVIEKGTKIYMGSQYYETTNTLTATCTANGTGAVWSFTIS